MVNYSKIFYTLMDEGRQISLTLTFYVKSHKNE
jgi:hypothetical protein